MRIGTALLNGQPAVVAAVGDDMAAAVYAFDSMEALLATPRETANAIVEEATASAPRFAVADLTWLPPVPRPGKVLCVALNNSANPDRIISGPQTPALFTKPTTSLTGHDTPLRLRTSYGRVHPEPELAVVIGLGGSNIPQDRALRHVYGYTVFNDLTSPTLRAEDTFHYRAIHPSDSEPDGVRYVESWVTYPARYKGSDTFGPIGPWITTADQVADPHTLRIVCRHNGQIITDDNTANLRFSVAEVIAFASSYMTLETGDIIAMGTALRRANSGAGAVQNLDLVARGGTVEVEIEGLGLLRNHVQNR